MKIWLCFVEIIYEMKIIKDELIYNFIFEEKLILNMKCIFMLN